MLRRSIVLRFDKEAISRIGDGHLGNLKSGQIHTVYGPAIILALTAHPEFTGRHIDPYWLAIGQAPEGGLSARSAFNAAQCFGSCRTAANQGGQVNLCGGFAAFL